MMQWEKTQIHKGKILLWMLAAVLLCVMLLGSAQPALSGNAERGNEHAAASSETLDMAEEEPSFGVNLVRTLIYLIHDVILFDIDNTDPARVAEAFYFAGYHGQVVLIGDWGNGRSGSFGRIMGLHESDKSATPAWLDVILKHEHGHYEQYKLIGILKYIVAIAVPSLLNQPADYYSQPWEVTADLLGGVTTHYHSPNSESEGIRYLNSVINASFLSLLIDFLF